MLSASNTSVHDIHLNVGEMCFFPMNVHDQYSIESSDIW